MLTRNDENLLLKSLDWRWTTVLQFEKMFKYPNSSQILRTSEHDVQKRYWTTTWCPWWRKITSAPVLNETKLQQLVRNDDNLNLIEYAITKHYYYGGPKKTQNNVKWLISTDWHGELRGNGCLDGKLADRDNGYRTSKTLFACPNEPAPRSSSCN